MKRNKMTVELTGINFNSVLISGFTLRIMEETSSQTPTKSRNYFNVRSDCSAPCPFEFSVSPGMEKC